MAGTAAQSKPAPAAFEPQVFDLETQLLSKGKATHLRGESELMSVAMKCHAEGGEVSLHCHAAEDHMFVVLQGEATYHVGKEEKEVVLRRHQGILLPRGTYYRFISTGDENLVQLRVGAGAGGAKAMMVRHDVKGDDLDPLSEADHYVAPVPVAGKFFR